MKNIINQSKVLVILCVSLLFIYGCNGGGGSADGSSSKGISEVSLAPAEFILALTPEETKQMEIDIKAFEADMPGSKLPTAHNPEPATLLLFGFGTAVMAAKKFTKVKIFFRRRVGV